MTKQKTAELSAAQFIPENKSLKSLKRAAEACQGCDLYKFAIQTVFGAGNAHAKVVFVGEQPGDGEDKEGLPFVGPAGKLLDKALELAGIRKSEAYFTNAVKHFKFEWQGKRRLHKKPRPIEVHACYPWLDEEIKEIKPDLVVCLGATAAQALLGNKFKVTQRRGEFIESDGAPYMMATVHPSSILRAPDEESRHEQMEAFVSDLKRVASFIRTGKIAQ
ncbi:MAG TPA: UdgX family uracil-DNA binding protein [Planktothrix sp.]|jgi:DNA polymerase